jgi:hypothetical protein
VHLVGLSHVYNCTILLKTLNSYMFQAALVHHLRIHLLILYQTVTEQRFDLLSN